MTKKGIEIKHSINEDYKKLYNSAPVMQHTIDKDGFVEMVSDFWLDAMGYSREEVIGEMGINFFTPEDRDRAKNELVPLFVRTGYILNEPYTFQKKNGETLQVFLSARGEPDEKGCIHRALVVSTDMTELIEAKEKIENLEERYRLIVEATRDGVWDWYDLSSKTPYWSETFYKVLGYEIGEIEPNVDFFNSDIIHPDDLEDSLKRREEAVKRSIPYDSEVRLKVKSGEYRWFSTKAYTIRDDQGNPSRVLGTISDVHEKKMAELALEESERRYKLLIEGTNDGIWDWYDIENNKSYWSDTFYTLLGYQPHEFEPGRAFFIEQIIHPHDLKVMFNALENTFQKEIPFDIEYRLKTKKGEYRWFRARANVIRKKDGTPSRMIGSVSDIHEQKMAKIALAESEQRLERALEVASNGIWEWNSNNNQVYVSDSWMLSLGYEKSHSKPTFEKWQSFMHPDDVSLMFESVREHIEERTPYFEFKNRLKRVDGTYRWNRAKGRVVIWNEDGSPALIVGTDTDITLEVEAQLALNQSEKRYKLIVEGTNDGVWDFYDMVNNKFYWSDNYYKLLGYDVGEMEPSFEFFENILIHPDDLPSLKEHVDSHLTKNTLFDIEYRLKTKQGEYKWFRAKASTTKDKNGVPVRMVGTISDIHERKMSEFALEGRTKELLQTNNRLEEFAYVATHDLRSPIINLQTLIELTENKTIEERIRLSANSRIKSNVNQLSNTLHDLIEVISLNKTLEERVEDIELVALCSSIIESIEEEIADSGIEIKADFSKVSHIQYSRLHLQSMFQNLITNATKYRDSNCQAVLEIESSRDKEGFVVIKFADNGLGIDLESKGNRLFKMFQRFHRIGEGKGLGLYIVRTQLELMGGRIEVESEVGKGTTFYLYLKEIQSKNGKG